MVLFFLYHLIDDVTESPDEEQEEGIVVGLFRASDDDEMDNDNSLITYSITSVSPIPPSVRSTS